MRSIVWSCKDTGGGKILSYTIKTTVPSGMNCLVTKIQTAWDHLVCGIALMMIQKSSTLQFPFLLTGVHFLQDTIKAMRPLVIVFQQKKGFILAY